MKYKKVLSRRTMLRGAGTVAIALPFLDAMRTTSVYAATPEPPVRAFNLFHGLGVPTDLQTEGFDGPLEPFGEIADKMAIIRGVDQIRCDESGINAHFDGASGAFTAEPPNGEAAAGGPSIDQLIRQHHYPNGLPSGVLSNVLMGTYFRRSRIARYIHSYNSDGSPSALPKETPRELFDTLFGNANGNEPLDPEEEKQRRLKKSVLDSVVEQYRYWQSDASNLGKASRTRIAHHLEKIREYEHRVFGELPATCMVPTEPGPSDLAHGSAADPGGEGIDITVDELVAEWRMMCDLWVTGMQCDLFRFGSATFQAAGERLRFTGNYAYNGNTVYDFNDAAEHGAGGSNGCSHEWWHKYQPQNANTQLRAHVHLMHNELVYLLKRMDEAEFADENGLTILENSLVSVSTESGDGRHNDVQRELSGIFHAVSGANERFATGGFIDVGSPGYDVYNTLLDAMGVAPSFGPGGFNQVSAILK